MVDIKRPKNLEVDTAHSQVSATGKDTINEADLLKGIHPLDTSIRVLREKVDNLDHLIKFEMTKREEIMNSVKKDSQWKIGLIITIALAILAIIFK